MSITTSRVIKTAPGEYPVSIAEQKEHSVVLVNDDDALIEQCISAATGSAELFQRRRYVTQTWTLYIDNGFPSEIPIPDPPMVDVSSIKYLDTDGNQQTLATSVYTVDNKREPGRVVRAYGQDWPAVRSVINTIEVEYIAGFGDPGDVPAPVRQAIMIIAGHLYEHRELLIVGVSVNEIPHSAYQLLRQDRIYLL